MKPTLLVLAAGMGSRYGGLKQIDPLGPHGETIMDYSVFDALRAGFGRVVFVIRHDFEDDFRKKVLSRYENSVPVSVVFQDINDLPEGFEVPADRTRPWGTAHAILTGRNVINEPFAVINADDFYGRNAFEKLGRFLSDATGNTGHYCMVGFNIGNTLTPNGSVSRGVCKVSDQGRLMNVVERRSISADDEGRIFFTDDNTGEKGYLASDTPVSMNLWGFTPDIFGLASREFVRFLNKYRLENKREFFIPSVIDLLVKHNEVTVDVLRTDSQWFGVTYTSDRPGVVKALEDLHEQGVYPDCLFK